MTKHPMKNIDPTALDNVAREISVGTSIADLYPHTQTQQAQNGNIRFS